MKSISRSFQNSNALTELKVIFAQSFYIWNLILQLLVFKVNKGICHFIVFSTTAVLHYHTTVEIKGDMK